MARDCLRGWRHASGRGGRSPGRDRRSALRAPDEVSFARVPGSGGAVDPATTESSTTWLSPRCNRLGRGSWPLRMPQGRSIGPLSITTPRPTSSAHVASTSSTGMVNCTRHPPPLGADVAGEINSGTAGSSSRLIRLSPNLKTAVCGSSNIRRGRRSAYRRTSQVEILDEQCESRGTATCSLVTSKYSIGRSRSQLVKHSRPDGSAPCPLGLGINDRPGAKSTTSPGSASETSASLPSSIQISGHPNSEKPAERRRPAWPRRPP